MKKNDLVTVEITDMTFDGAGIGHVDTQQGKFPVFVRAAAVGDVVQCRVIKVLKHYAAAILTQIVTPSAHRVAPACPVAEKCGGCAFHHVSYQAELEYKTNAVRQAYKLNFSGEISVNDCVPSPLQSHYRNKVQLPLSPEGKFGFYSPRSHRVIPVSDCSAAYGEFSIVIKAVEEWIRKHQISPYDETTGRGLVRHLFLRRGHYSGETMVCLTVNAGNVDAIPAKDDLIETMKQFPEVKSVWINFNSQKTNVILGDRFHLLFGAERIFDTMNGVRFAISPRSFYQVNTLQAEAIYAAAAAYLSPDDILLDLYCGIGTIGLTCARKVKQVVGIEVIPQAIEDAKENARRNGIENACFFASDAANTLQILSTLPHKPTAVIVDPPRKGLSIDAIAALREIAPEKIVYISCNPATQARDLALLRDSYVPGPITPYDMFPRTGHVESIVCLVRKEDSEKQEGFFINTKLLANAFGVTPLMYGSLGLEYLTGKNLNVDDVDILIPEVFLEEKWNEFSSVLEEEGYTLIDEKEHIFEKEGIRYSYAQIEGLEAFAGIPMTEIQIVKNKDVRFKLLTLQQYLRVYTASAKDGYRIDTRNKRDFEKIALIQAQLAFLPKEKTVDLLSRERADEHIEFDVNVQDRSKTVGAAADPYSHRTGGQR